MHTKLIHLTCLVLVLGLALTSTASAEIVGWWKFDKGSGTIAYDSSHYNNDVFFNGDPQWVVGYFNGGLEFDGSGDYLDRGVYEPSLDIVGELTFTAWVKPGAMLRDHKIGGNITTGPNGGGYMMGIYSNDNVELEGSQKQRRYFRSAQPTWRRNSVTNGHLVFPRLYLFSNC